MQSTNKKICVYIHFNHLKNLKVPLKNYSNVDTECPLVVTVNGVSVSQKFTYKNSITPTLTSINPIRGEFHIKYSFF
jgi:hypothetical protein